MNILKEKYKSHSQFLDHALPAHPHTLTRGGLIWPMDHSLLTPWLRQIRILSWSEGFFSIPCCHCILKNGVEWMGSQPQTLPLWVWCLQGSCRGFCSRQHNRCLFSVHGQELPPIHGQSSSCLSSAVAPTQLDQRTIRKMNPSRWWQCLGDFLLSSRLTLSPCIWAGASC